MFFSAGACSMVFWLTFDARISTSATLASREYKGQHHKETTGLEGGVSSLGVEG